MQRTPRSSSAAGKALEPGDTLGHYEIVDKIGEGGMGVVYRAVDRSLDRPVALKLLSKESSANAQRLERLRLEAKTLASLNHPNIVTIHAILEFGGVPSLVMEFVDGSTLRELIPESGLPLVQTLDYSIPVADAVAAAHANGLSHRDLKPENIMVSRAGQIKVLDFGIARRGDRAQVNEIAGTPRYMSPEQLRGSSVGPWSDVYSFALILHELCTGKLPPLHWPEGKSATELLREAGVAPILTELLWRCLREDPAGRPKTMALVLDELVAIRSHEQSDAMRGLVETGLQAAPRTRSLAVLPLQDLSPQHEQEVFCIGLAEEIASELSRLKELRVSFVSQIDRETTDPVQLGRSLGTEAIVDGSVRSAGEKLRIHVRLVSVADGSLLWDARFDRSIVDAFVVQDELAKAVAEAFDMRLTPQTVSGISEIPAAYSAYLRGRYFWGRRYEDGVKRALECFREAIERDPLMARAHSGCADCYVILGHYGYLAPHVAYSQARKSVEEALALSPELADAHATRGWIEAFYDRRSIDAAQSFERARSLNPSYATGWEWSGIFEVSRGNAERGVELIREAHLLDPVSLMIQTILAWAQFEVGDEAEARRLIHQVRRLDPRFVFALNLEGMFLATLGDTKTAIERLERAVALSGREGLSLAFLGFVYGLAGRRDEVDEIVAELREASKDRYVSPLHVALPLIGAGQIDEGLDWLEKAVDGQDTFIASIHRSRLLAPVSATDRFKELIRRFEVV